MLGSVKKLWTSFQKTIKPSLWMSIIGLTGGIGSGKTFISKIFNSNNIFVVFDSDLCAKQIMEHNIDVIDMIKEKIGKKSYVDGLIQTKYISDVIFNDKKKLNELNKIVHPKVLEELKKFKYNNPNKLIIIESAILFETGIYLQNDYNILVKAPVKDRINRVMNRDKISKEDVLKRINSQWSDSKKMDLADFVIDNIDKLETEKIVKQLIIDLILRYEKN